MTYHILRWNPVKSVWLPYQTITAAYIGEAIDQMYLLRQNGDTLRLRLL